MERGIPEAKVRAIVRGVAPKLDVFVNGSTEVNAGRAQQSGSLARRPRDVIDAATCVEEVAEYETLRKTGRL